MELRGTVRFRFRSPEHDIDVLLEGEAKWVESLREEIGLAGEVGVVQPLAARMVDPDEPEPESATGDDEDFFEELPLPEEAVLPGPPPDPSRIPPVPRIIGSLDVDSSITELGGRERSDPDISVIIEVLDQVQDEIEPLKDNLSGNPLAEAWIQLLLTLVVREHGHTSLPVSLIDEAVGERIDLHGIDLVIFLDRLWMLRRLERIHGGVETQYAPNPSWLEAQ
tara:strand:- start:409 stop:1077 length:669 start_codon:yes stop_codon:yes gene_type:complete